MAVFWAYRDRSDRQMRADEDWHGMSSWCCVKSRKQSESFGEHGIAWPDDRHSLRRYHPSCHAIWTRALAKTAEFNNFLVA